MPLFRLDIARTPLREVAIQTEPNPSPRTICSDGSQPTTERSEPASHFELICEIDTWVRRARTHPWTTRAPTCPEPSLDRDPDVRVGPPSRTQLPLPAQRPKCPLMPSVGPSTRPTMACSA